MGIVVGVGLAVGGGIKVAVGSGVGLGVGVGVKLGAVCRMIGAGTVVGVGDASATARMRARTVPSISGVGVGVAVGTEAATAAATVASMLGVASCVAQLTKVRRVARLASKVGYFIGQLSPPNWTLSSHPTFQCWPHRDHSKVPDMPRWQVGLAYLATTVSEPLDYTTLPTRKGPQASPGAFAASVVGEATFPGTTSRQQSCGSTRHSHPGCAASTQFGIPDKSGMVVSAGSGSGAASAGFSEPF